MNKEYKEVIGRGSIILFLAGLLHLTEWYQNYNPRDILSFWAFYFAILTFIGVYWIILPLIGEKRT